MRMAAHLHRLRDVATSRTATWIYFALILLLGIAIAKDYGISWDEKAMYVLGEKAYGFIRFGKEYPVYPGIRFHGAWFEVLQYAVQELLGLRYARDMFILRHALNFGTFWIGLLAIYGIALRTFKSRSWALVAMLMFLLSPRQFGHAFFNGRDIPAMALFTVKIFTLLVLVEKPTARNAFLHGIASGLVVAMRVGLLFLPVYTVLFLGLKMCADFKRDRSVAWKRYAVAFGTYVVTSIVATVAFWPLLWQRPLRHLLDALQNMLWEQQAPGGFYWGETVGSLPWHWVPVHIISKTPLLYVLLACVGIVVLVVRLWRRPVSALSDDRNTLLFFLWFILPIFAVIFLHATLFDEWRHLYFVYPALLLLSVSGLHGIWQFLSGLRLRVRNVLRAALVIVCAGSFAGTSIWMVQNHPLQYVYFSIPSRFVEGKFELDYWGLSFRQGFEWILEHDTDDLISVSVTSSPGWENLNILTQEQRRRLTVRRQFDTKYVLDNFRWHQYRHDIPDEFKVHSIMVSGMEVLGIYRNPKWVPGSDTEKDRMEDYEIQMRFDPKDTSLW